MDKGTKVQLVQMQSLMERMDKHYTKDEANAHVNFKLVKEGLGEVDNHAITGDRFENYIGRIKKGWQVHVGYVTTEKLALSRTYPTQDSYNELSAKLNGNTGEKLNDYLGTTMDDMNNFITNPGKAKSFKFPVKENYEIIKFQEYSMAWMDRQTLAQFYAALNDKEIDLRRASGFGADGAENTWRNKSTIYKSGEHAGETKYTYGGAGVMPIVKSGGNTYNDSGSEDGFQDSWKDPLTGKHALRQKPVKYGEPRFFLHDLNDDTYEEVSKDIVYTLAYKFKQPKIEQELEADEKQFVDALALITAEKSSVWNLMEDKCLFISYTLVMPDGSKKPTRLVNPELKMQLEPIIDALGLRNRLTDAL